MAVSNVGVNRIADSVIRRRFGVSFPIQSPTYAKARAAKTGNKSMAGNMPVRPMAGNTLRERRVPVPVHDVPNRDGAPNRRDDPSRDEPSQV